ncbi:hypothetical protein PGTUg99_030280 [Puccinia graminis f. sp. tritici]|uniref:Uncharacterized protein n=1 Tax=Puccinia graminis f. sp. tritici TaxID=56615 RepID=A0A5B0RU02_PUCGR|nr:hypothetical protein PGTUg99_030280 [Puccinia graminis f. sp. tritici]
MNDSSLFDISHWFYKLSGISPAKPSIKLWRILIHIRTDSDEPRPQLITEDNRVRWSCDNIIFLGQLCTITFFCYINRERDKMGNSWSSNASKTKDGWVRKPSAFGAGKKPKKDAGGQGGNSNIQGSSDKTSKKSKKSKSSKGWVRKPSAFGSNPKRSNKHAGVLGSLAAASGATATHSSHADGGGSGC